MAKHHYLPQFYLRGFTNEQGQFMIWSVKEGRFKAGGKPFSPASHFFLPDDNTIITDGVKDDYLEELYSGMESRYARIFEKIKAVDQGFGLDQQDVVWLNYFPGELFWRVPSQRNVINTATDLHQLNQLGVAVIDKKTMRQIDPDKFAEAVKADPSLLLYKLSDGELDIGISYKPGETYAIISYDQYDHQDVNLHLYCTPLKQFLLEFDDHDSPKTVFIAKEDLVLIPEGLQNLMQQAALKGKSMFFKPD